MTRSQQYLYEIYKEKSFSKAAANLYVSQPALSAMVKREEEEIGHLIFDRSSNPIRLTEIGTAYMKAVEETMNIEQNLHNYIEDYSGLKTGILTLGGANFTTSCVYPGIISSFHKNYPGISIRLFESGSMDLQELTLHEEIDLIMDSCIFSDELFSSYALFQGNVLLAVPLNRPINRSLKNYQLTEEDVHKKKHLDPNYPGVPLLNFQEEPFLLLNKGNDMHDRGIALCQNSGFTPHVYMYLDQLMTTYHMAMRGLGVAFVTDTLVNMSFLKSNAVYYRIDDRMARRNIFIAHKKHRYVTHAMQAFIQASHDYFA